MPALLALLSSLAWGVADVAGGVATRRVGSPRTLALSYPAGALAITFLALTIVPGVIDAPVVWISVYTAVTGTIAMELSCGTSTLTGVDCISSAAATRVE